MQRFLTMTIALSLHATTLWSNVDALYHITLCTPSNQQQHWQQRLQQGWQALLIRISGNRYINTLDELSDSGHFAQNALDHFQYLKDDACPNHKPYQLHLYFKPKATHAFLAQHHQPIWPQPRPKLLVWMKTIHADAQPASYLDAHDPALRTVSTIAKQRGISVLLPNMDTQDQITPIPDAYHQTILSKRYHIQQQLIGTLDLADQSVQWTLVMPHSHTQWHHRNVTTLDDALSQGLTHAIDVLAEAHAIDQSLAFAEKSHIVVHPIASLHQFEQMMAYLKHMDMITHVQVDHIADNHVELSLSLQGNMQRLAQALHQEGRLRLDPMHLIRHHITYTWQAD